MADKRISQLVERVTLLNNDVFPIVASGAATTNKVTLQTIDDYMQTNLNFGVTSVAMTVPTGLSVTGTPITSTGTFIITFTAGYSIPTTAKQSQWDTAYNNRIVSVTAPITFASNVLGITQSGAASDGYLSSTDWNTFNNKQAALTFGNITETTSSVLTITGGTGAVIGSGTTIQVTQANGSQDGFLDSADWTTFNGKQNALTGTGIVKSTGGTITYLTDNTSNWDSAYNDKINSAAVTGTTTKTLTLTQQDGGTITTTWTDLDTGTVTSVGVSMPSAFSVANSPITSSGTIAITGAGLISQYIDGTGALQTFPSGLPPTGAAGGDLQGTYPNPTVHKIHGIDLQSGTPTTNDVWVYGGSPAKWQHQILHSNQVTEDGNLFYTDARARASISESVTGLDYNSTTGVISTSAGYGIPTTASQTTWDAAYNDKINSAAVTGTTTKTLTLNQQDGGTITASWTDDNTDAVTSVFGRTGAVIATEGDYSLTQLSDVTITTPSNGQFLKYDGASWINAAAGTVTSVALATGTTGTDIGVTGSPITGAGTITLNIPVASATNTGKLSNTDWSTFNSKEPAITAGTTAQYYRGDKTFQNFNSAARGSISLTTTGTSGAATYDSATGVLNVPNYATDLSGYVTLSTAQTISGAKIFSNAINIRHNGGTSTDAALRLRGTNATARTTRLQFEDYNGTIADGIIDFSIPTAGTASSALFKIGINGAGLTFDYNNTATFSGNVAFSNYIVSDVSFANGYKLMVRNPSMSIDALQGSYFGYSSGYGVLLVGHTGTNNRSLAFGVDVSGNPSGAFSGWGNEYIWRNAASFITPNSINNGYNTLLSWNSSGQVTINNLIATSLTLGNNIQIGDYSQATNSLTFAASANGIAKINFYDSNNTEGLYIRTDGESYGGTMTFGARWDDDEGKIAFKMYQVSAGGAYHARVGIGTLAPSDALEVVGVDNGITVSSVAANRPVFKLVNGSTTMLKMSANGTYAAIADNSGSDFVFLKNGCFGVGTDTTAGNRFWIKGTSEAAGDTSLYIQNSAGTSLLTVKNNNTTHIGTLQGGGQALNVSYSFAVRGNLTGTEQNLFHIGNTGSGVNDGYMRIFRDGVAKVLIAADNSRGGDTYFNGGGNFGINTDTPAAKLHVVGTSYIGSMTAYSPAVHIRGGYYGGPRLQVYGLDADGSAWMGLGTDMSGNPFELSIYYPTNGASSVCFGRYSYTTGAQYSGFTATARLSYGGTWTCAGDVIAYGSPSDARLKTIKEKVPNALDKVLKLNGYRFDWNETNELTKIKEDIGVIAQEVVEVFPELAKTNEDGYMSVRYQGLTAVLIEAIKEQQKQIEELKNLVNAFTK